MRSRRSRSEAVLSETDSIEFQAALWIDRRTGGEPFDEAGFNAWLAGDPRRESVFEAMWRHIMGSDMDAALGAYEQRKRSRRIVIASAAAILLVGIGGYNAMPLIELQLAPTQEFAVADGAIREVRLPDGTQLTLAGDADIKVRYTRHDRVVELTQGTVFAHVAHDGRRPFRIDAGDSRIVDVGTSFEVRSKPGEVRVTVESGVVRFGKNSWFSEPISLTATQAANLDQAGLTRIADVPANNVARWRSGWVEYRGTPLGQVVADLQTLSPLPIEIADKGLAGKLVGGRIRLTDPAGQLQNLSIIYDFQVRRTDTALVISRN